VTALLLKGFAVGFGIAVPVGPIGVLCIRRSLAHGPRAGIAVGMGAAVADAFYGAVAGFGLSTVSAQLLAIEEALGIVGGLLLIAMGLRTVLAEPSHTPATVTGRSLWGAFLGTFLLTLTNPATILTFLAIYAGLGLASALSAVDASVFVLGVLLGSAAWWLILANVAGSLRGHMNRDWMQTLNRLSGSLLLLFGLVVLVVSLRKAIAA
jgi:threonine/homoserine/homoserine lactone efflux protein